MGNTEVAHGAEVMCLAGLGVSQGLRGLTALRRATDAELEDALRAGLARDLPDLAALWRATAFRPLATAVAGLEPELREHYGYIEALLGDGPLPALPRRVGRVTAIGQARLVEQSARRIRRVLGRLATAGDPVLTPLVPRHADAGLLCALVLAVSTGEPRVAEPALTSITRRGDVTVPGFPVSTLDDAAGPWQRASADATELGARLAWSRPTPRLVVPRAWLGPGGWPTLWARAHRAHSAGVRRRTH
jgi:hypothetical protein